MTITSSDHKLELKLLIDKNSQKVMFAEVGKDMVDFLFSLLSLPIGSVAKLISVESTFGPLRNTYCSWEQLDHSFLSSSRMTASSLIPDISPTSSSNFARLQSSADLATAKKEVYVCDCKFKFTDGPKLSYCSKCLNYLGTVSSYVGPGLTKEDVEREGYVKPVVTYFVTDDLSMVPTTSFASIELLNKMGLKDLSLLERKTVSLDVQLVSSVQLMSTFSKRHTSISILTELDV